MAIAPVAPILLGVEPADEGTGNPGNLLVQPEKEVATLADGRQIEGRLDLAAWPMVFRPANGQRVYAASDLQQVRFPAREPEEDGNLGQGRILLVGRQSVAGEITALDTDHAKLRLFDRTERTVSRDVLVGAERPVSTDNPSRPGLRSTAFADHGRFNSRQDSLIFRTGDELYGQIKKLDPRGIVIEGLFGSRRVAISRAEVLRFRGAPPKPVEAQGLIVRAWFVSVGVPTQQAPGHQTLDCLEGVVLHSEEGALALRNDFLGRLNIPRRLLRRLEILHLGKRIVLDPSFHHLGNETLPHFDVAVPEGTRLESHFHLEAIPAGAVTLSLRVMELEATGEGAKYTNQIERGHLRTRVLLGSQGIDYLNRHVGIKHQRGQRIQIVLPREQLVVGENRIRIEQTPQQDDPEEYDDVGIYWLTVEFQPAP